MRCGFIKPMTSAKKMQESFTRFTRAGVMIDDITISKNFATMVDTLQKGDVVIVENYAAVFDSMNDFMSSVTLMERGVTIESLDEPDMVIQPETIDFIRMLNKLGYGLRKTPKEQVRPKNKRLGRPLGTKKFDDEFMMAQELIAKHKLSVQAACRKVGFQPRTYYRYKTKLIEK